MPEEKIKKEWYCTDSQESHFPAVLMGGLWIIVLSIAFLLSPRWVVDHYGHFVRGLCLIVAYMIVWSAIFMRRREAKE